MRGRGEGLKGRGSAWLFAIASIAATGFAATATASAEPAKFWGVDPVAQPTGEQFQRLERGGVDSVRFPISWNEVETNQGAVPDWSAVDSLVGGIASAGMEGLPFVTGAPTWVVPTVSVNAASGSFAPLHLPVRTGAERAAWQNFLHEAVQRYGPNGTYWAAHSAIPYRPIRNWQIWNEENFKYFVARPDPAEYGKLVKLSYTAIKELDPGAQLILGGMFVHPKEGEARYKKLHPRPAYFATEFLEKLYRTTPGIKSKFNGIALHPYTYDYRHLTPDIEEVRAVLKANEDAGKGIWITEMGWSSKYPNASNGRNKFEKGPSGQVAQLKGSFGLLERNQVKWKIKRVFWFSVDDDPKVCNFCDGSGLFGPGFVPKPSWSTYVRFAGGSVE